MNAFTKLRQLFVPFVAAVALAGCATPQQKLEKRKQEKYAAYAALSATQRAEVDHGQIAVGMPMDAVYIAWGKPSQVVSSGSEAGTFVIWVYLGVYLQSYYVSGWNYGAYCNGPYAYYGGPYINYYPVNYPKSEVTFEQGIVRSWKTLPGPLN